MSSEPRAFFTIDRGGASVAAAVVGHLDGRWRLLGSLVGPASVPDEAILAEVVARLRTADPDLAESLGVRQDAVDGLAHYRARSTPPVTLAVLAGSDRALSVLGTVAARTGWRTVGASVESHDPAAMTALALGREVSAVLVGAGEPPAADERGALDELAALTAAVARRRPELTIVLSGAMAARRSHFRDGDAGQGASDVVVAPASSAGNPPGSELHDVLERLRETPDDSRVAMVRTAAALAAALDRRIELLEVGFDGGLRASATSGAAGEPPTVTAVASAEGGLVPPALDNDAIDRVMGWSTAPVDRHRFSDRLREVRDAPWADVAGDGARLRLAAARAALARLVELTPDLSAAPPPDLTIVAGGVFTIAPGAAIALAVADVVRRPGATQLAMDHARLLAPLGTIEDGDRDRIVADLADDLLAPVGGVVIPAGLRAGRVAGRVVVHGPTGPIERELVAGTVERLDLAPGEHAIAAFEFRDDARMGGRGRRMAVEVAGGLAGLLVDLRDVPLRLPERAERRREVLAGWQAAAWPETDA